MNCSMKHIFIFLSIIACSSRSNYDGFGEPISAEQSMEIEQFLTKVSSESKSFKVRGVIQEVCQMKGCWMTLQNENGVNIRVTFKDYGFFVPKDISGKEVIIEGEASREILEEDLAKHYADDSGKTYDESMRNSISFVAHGVLVSKT